MTSASRTRRVAARALAVAAAVAACAAAGADAAESRKVSARGPRKASPGGWGGTREVRRRVTDWSGGRAFLQLLQLDFSQIDWGQVFTDEFSLDSLTSLSSSLVDSLASAVSGDLFTGVFGSL